MARRGCAIDDGVAMGLRLRHVNLQLWSDRTATNGFKRIAAISLATDYDIEQTAELKALLSDPEALAKAAAAAAAASGPAAGGEAKKEEAAAEEEEEESEEGMGFDLFD